MKTEGTENFGTAAGTAENFSHVATSGHEDDKMKDSLLTEVERQKKYLDRLPSEYKFPLFNSKQALESQRKSGYRDTAAAAREIVDNAYEAGATEIDVVFEHSRSEKGRDLVTAVAFLDNGSGMIQKMIQYALSLGGGTHFDEPKSIGKFGFGLPNASINQTRRVEVYSRVSPSDPIMCGWLDVNDVKEHNLQEVDSPVERNLPAFVESYLKRNKKDFGRGTVVVWVLPDRLTYKTGAKLKEHLMEDFGITYRYLLHELDLRVEGRKVEIVDPLFLDPRGRYYLPPDPDGANDKGGAIETYSRSFVIKHYVDPDTEVAHVTKIDSMSELENDPNMLSFGTVNIRMSRLPYGFAADKHGNDEFSKKRLDIRINGRGISFVRSGREIETLKLFPYTESDKAHGLGDWKPLQNYDYHWACEISFGPELDEVFGITNDKQKVRLLEDMWRVLSDDDVQLDAAIRKETAIRTTIGKHKAAERKKARDEAATSDSGEPTQAEMAATGAEIATGRTTRIPERNKNQVAETTNRQVRERVQATQETIEEAERALEAEKMRRPYKIEYFDDLRGPFYEPAWGPYGQVIGRINRKHPFFEAVYGTLFSIAGGRKAKEAVDLLILALAKAELAVERPETQDIYQTQREDVWSPFLEKSLKILERLLDGQSDNLESEAEDLEDNEA